MFGLYKTPKIILTFCLIVPIFAAFGQAPTIEDDKAAITAVSKARAEAFNQKNAQGIAIHFTSDAVLMAPDRTTLSGQKAIRDYYQSIFDEFEVVLDSYYEEVSVSGDMAIGRGEATVKLTPIGKNKSTSSSSKYLNVLRRQSDGSWKTTHDIWNSNGVSSLPN